MDCHGPSTLAMTEVWGLDALSALGLLPRPFNNKGIRHGKAGKTPSLLGLRDVAIQAAPGFSETTQCFPRLSGLPRAFGPHNDEAGHGRPRGRPLARCTATGGRPYGDRIGAQAPVPARARNRNETPAPQPSFTTSVYAIALMWT
jgi:hypothetical protein